MLLQFDLIPARVKGRLFESRGRKPRARACVGAEDQSPKRETKREKRPLRRHRTQPGAGIFAGIKSGTPLSWLPDAPCQ
jgi:hypothetical protein